MAKIKLDRAKVVRVFQGGKAMKVVETVTVQGNEWSQYFTVWFPQPHGKNEGDMIGVQGSMTHRPGSYQTGDGTTIHTSDVSINNPQLVDAQDAGAVRVENTLDVLDNAPF